ncbi:class I SAM-dependent methyltransferase [Campylobacter canadensis]|uniref:Class I SAM-dependent methyltransferase n=1 Tax=Campylobacter canadensis TaxID=449520 RepID=A0ABS7WQL9_9BACT|nr:class I SAM-dependent methyltransferase [Campylobacter canadensis]MBZ7986676.1 class I SAM-dependent methyltransferase [Campylobacter canadensis]MBZ7993919.1 class I SAM-dependent methyltransferase [Campylobacter canadensis]MBZ7996235.1 class I SAM-dependent methyltransferase [Campylobacter canadensis]MBZ7997712.1 class I SAM-dependent methyltransferase [Campylobacter canadensis]MBZ7999252.1 class I SAM-dependent methyltransferase [Campylobacter canadensis]
MKLSNLSQSLFITLYYKALEFSHKKAILKDEKAFNLVKIIDYDFSKIKDVKLSRVATCIRSAYFDKKCKEFINKNDNCLILILAAGLDARYDRLNASLMKNAYFVECDLGEVIELKKQYFTPNFNQEFISADVLDDDFLNKIDFKNKKILVIIEGLFMYFSNEQIKKVMANLSKLQEFELLCDFVGSRFFKKIKNNVIKKMNISYLGKINSPKDFFTLCNNYECTKIEAKNFMSEHILRWGFVGILNLFFTKKFSFKFAFMLHSKLKHKVNS